MSLAESILCCEQLCAFACQCLLLRLFATVICDLNLDIDDMWQAI